MNADVDTHACNDDLVSQNALSFTQSMPPLLSETDIDLDDSNEDWGDTSSDADFYTDSEDDEQIEPNLCNSHLYQPLYSGAEITICGAICAIMQFCTTYKLSYSAIGNLLKLLIILCPTPNHLPKSFYMLRKFFEQFQSNYKHSKYCTNCNLTVCDCNCANSYNTGHIMLLDVFFIIS